MEAGHKPGRKGPRPSWWKRQQLLAKIRAGWAWNRLTRRWKDETEKACSLAVDEFIQLRFNDSLTGVRLKYNLFIPRGYDRSRKYPLVLFIHDAGVTSAYTKNDAEAGSRRGHLGDPFGTSET